MESNNKDFCDLSSRQKRRKVLENSNKIKFNCERNLSQNFILQTQCGETSTDARDLYSTSSDESNPELRSLEDSDLEESVSEYPNSLSDRMRVPVNQDKQTFFNKNDFVSKLQELIFKYNVAHNFVNELLVLLKKNGHDNLPLDCRSLLNTPRNVFLKIQKMNPGEYIHLGIEDSLIKSVRHYFKDTLPKCVLLDVNMDGLPISKSSGSQFWPILGSLAIKERPTKPFVIGLFQGPKKPSDVNEYLKYFVENAKELLEHGINVDNHNIKFKLNAIICDAPAKAFVSGTKSHNAYFGCSKCYVEGEYYDHRMIFPEVNSKLRTDINFIEREQPEHHTISSSLEELGIGMVSQIPLDYMHLICLGVMKRLLQFWVKGSKNVRLNESNLKILSKSYLATKKSISNNFARNPRDISDVDRWKATEFRQFLLYSGPVLLQNVLSKTYYQHFLCLSIAVRILSKQNYIDEHLDYAKSLLLYFVKEYDKLYDKRFVSYNIHNLIHVSDDVVKFGPLDNFSAFKYENHMNTLKKYLKPGRNSLQQLYNRIMENNQQHSSNNTSIKYPIIHQKNDKIIKLEFATFFLSLAEHQNCFLTNNDEIAVIDDIYLNEQVLHLKVKYYLNKQNLFDIPCESNSFQIFQVNKLNLSDFFNLPVSSIKEKCIVFDHNNITVTIPLLHCDFLK